MGNGQRRLASGGVRSRSEDWYTSKPTPRDPLRWWSISVSSWAGFARLRACATSPPDRQPLPGRPKDSQGRVAPQSVAARPASGSAGVGAGTDPHAGRRRDSDDVTAAVLKRDLPAWLISAVFHMLVLIVLGLAAMSIRDRSGISLDFQPVYAEQLGDQLEFDSPLGMDQTDQVEEPIISISDLVEVTDPLAAPSSTISSPTVSRRAATSRCPTSVWP